jgi:hypothetical protein
MKREPDRRDPDPWPGGNNHMLNGWKIGPKLYLIVGFLAAVAAAIGFLGIDAMRNYNDQVGLISSAYAS